MTSDQLPADAQQTSETLTVALVDDEPDLRANLTVALEREGLKVEQHADGDHAAVAFEQSLPDLAILDIMLPGVDGRELCRRLRARSQTLPILFLTSRDEEFDRVLGLELGADDYLCKPFSLRELIARVRVLVRRLRLAQAPQAGPGHASDDRQLRAADDQIATDAEAIVRGPLRLDLDRYQATWSERALALTITEFRLLHALAKRPGYVRSRSQLIKDAYPQDLYKSERTIDTHVKRLRKKIEQSPTAETTASEVTEAEVIETVYGVGYRFAERWMDPENGSE